MNTQSVSVSQIQSSDILSHPFISIARDFSPYTGARYRTDGPNSGQEFRQDLLEPRFLQALEQGQKLIINLDGAEGYATSFLEEAFGGLARAHGAQLVLDYLEFQSLDEPLLADEIKKYIRDTARRK